MQVHRERRLRALIGQAIASRRSVLGRQACRRAAEERRLHLLVVAEDAGASAERDSGVPESVQRLRCGLDKRELGGLAGRMELALLGITDGQLAASLLECERDEGT